MKKELQETIQQAVKKFDRALLAVKIHGGYKCRETLQSETGWPNQKIEPYIDKSERKLRNTVVSLIIAEAMLKEPPPSFHARWDEYESRRKEILKVLEKE